MDWFVMTAPVVRCGMTEALKGVRVNVSEAEGAQSGVLLGVVRLQSDAFKSELKVRQKERVPSRFDTRLWLYGLHRRVQSEAFRFNR